VLPLLLQRVIELTTKRKVVWDPTARRYYRIKPIKCDYKTELDNIWQKYHYLKEEKK
jgi:hypothetical protein